MSRFFTFFAAGLFLLVFIAVSSPVPTSACVIAPRGSSNFTLCTGGMMGSHIDCIDPDNANQVYACLYTPPADPEICQEADCPPLPPACTPPYHCVTEGTCDPSNIDWTKTCPGTQECCSHNSVPTPTTSPCIPADTDPNCGGHMQPCCCSTGVGGDCDSSPGNPLNCDDNVLGNYICCYQNDSSTICQTALNVTPVPTPVDGINLFCAQDTPLSGIRTAIGCVKASDPKAFVIQLITLAVRLAAGITLLSIIYAGFLFTTAFGDKNRIAESKELLFNSLIYLLIVALAVTLINFLGARVLNLDLLGFQV